MRKNSIALFLLIVGCPIGALAQTASSVEPSASEKLVLQARGVGSQIYSCVLQEGHYNWKLKAPEAKLLDDSGKVIGTHSAGPKWRLYDGSEVLGKLLASEPRPGTIPWLKLQAQSIGNKGQLNQVDMVLRTNTQGGVAPPDGCDLAHAGAEAKVAYSATYSFFRPN